MRPTLPILPLCWRLLGTLWVLSLLGPANSFGQPSKTPRKTPNKSAGQSTPESKGEAEKPDFRIRTFEDRLSDPVVLDVPELSVKRLIFVDGLTGEAVADQAVQIAVMANRQVRLKWKTQTTNFRGSVSVHVERLHSFRFQIPGHNTWCSVTPNPDDKRSSIVKIWEGTRIVGRLEKASGEPASDLVVQVGCYVNDGLWRKRLGLRAGFQTWDHGDWPNWRTVVTTSKKGLFTVVIPPAFSLSWLRVGSASMRTGVLRNRSGDAYPAFEIERTDLAGLGIGDIDLGVIRLKQGVTLKGRVVDVAGKPVANAYVMAWSGRQEGNAKSFSDLHTTTADAEGNYELPEMLPGRAIFQANEPGGDPNRALFVKQAAHVSNKYKEVRFDVTAAAHVILRFKLVDRRETPAPLKFRSPGYIDATLADRIAELTPQRSMMEFTDVGGAMKVVCRLPVGLRDGQLYLPAAEGVKFTYVDDRREWDPTRIVPIEDLSGQRERTIYLDDRK
jgi:hypothetical protein